jgi:uncharacterized membrane protein
MSPESPASPRTRVASIDALRGLAMIVMALDHTRDYFHSSALLFDPEDLARTTTALFFTRWVTHLCAPVFMLTAGLGAFYWRAAGRSTRELSRFLLTRGLWLVFLELTVLRLAYNFGLSKGPIVLTILWALGGAMIALAALVHLPARALAALSIGIVAFHNLTDGFRSESWLWTIAHQRGVLEWHGVVVVVGYPLVPWIAVMALGFCLGPVMRLEPARRRRFLVLAGLALTAAFVVLRTVNVYGNPEPWLRPSALSFLKCLKYPPSLDFLLMTLGPSLLVLAWLERLHLPAAHPLLVFGRVPLFYFLLHLYLIHGLAVPLALLRYGSASFLFGSAPSADSYPVGYGYSLAAVYLIWLVVVALSYPLCRWFAGVKQRRRDWWLAYL